MARISVETHTLTVFLSALSRLSITPTSSKMLPANVFQENIGRSIARLYNIQKIGITYVMMICPYPMFLPIDFIKTVFNVIQKNIEYLY